MIQIKDNSSIERMIEAGKRLAAIFNSLKNIIVPGKSTLAIDAWIDEQLNAHELISSTKGYHGYRHASCISINDEVVHGVPHAQRLIAENDLVKVDVCASFHGYCADMTRPFFMGIIKDKPQINTLVLAGKTALDAGIAQVVAGKRLSDISAAIGAIINSYGFGIVRDFAGHGIGRSMHEEPDVPNYGKPGRGPLLKTGMAFALEPMITLGDDAVYIANDGWTARTVDKSLAMHIEDTVVVSDHGPLVTTRSE